MKSRALKLVKDPFVILIALVVMVPAVLIAYTIARQPAMPSTAVNSVSQESNKAPQEVKSVDTAESQPITQAEQPTPTEKPLAQPAPVAGESVCDETQKQAALTAKEAETKKATENHERQKDRLRISRLFTNKYWDEEVARHQAIMAGIESTYTAALAAAKC